MAIKIQNITKQVIPIIIPGPNGGEEKRILPRETVVLAIQKPTSQIDSLVKKNKLRIRK